jgi:hypothetical protein
VLKASPTSTPHHSSVRQRPVSHARSAAPQARISSRINTGSTPFSRVTATNEGNTASASAPAIAGQGPRRRLITQYSAATESTPMIASGSSRLRGEKPNNFALTTCTHSASGGLSTVTSPPGSKETNRKLCHERSIDRTPAE